MSLSRVASSGSPTKEEDSNDLMVVLSEELQCDICLKTFVDPKTLACLHSFCKICVDRLMKVAANTHDLSKLHRRHFFSCPVCRKRHAIPCNGVDGLQTHFKLANLCNILRKNQTSTVPQAHYCTVHTDRRLKSFCNTCVTCLCTDCKDTHQNHNIEDLDIAAKTQRNKVADSIVRCSSLVGRVDNHVSDIDGFLNKEADLIAAVKTARNKLVAAIDTQESEQLKQIRTLFTNRSGKRLAEYRVEMIRMRRSLQEACSEADMVNSLEEVDLLLNVKKTLGTLSGDGFDPDDLPSFYSHDILFDRPCLPENVLGFISYKQINRGSSGPSSQPSGSEPSSSAVTPHHLSDASQSSSAPAHAPDDLSSSAAASSHQPASQPDSPPSGSTAASSSSPQAAAHQQLPDSPVGAQPQALLPPALRATKWFQKVVHDHRANEYQSAIRGLTHDGRIVSYEWTTDELHAGSWAVQALLLKSPSHDGFVRCRSALSRFPDISDMDLRIATSNGNPSGNSLWLCDRVKELTALWDTISMRRTAVRSIDATRYFRCVVNDFRTAVGGTWLRGVTHEGAIVSYKYEGPGDGCISIDREQDPYYHDLLTATWRMPDRIHLPLFRDQLYVLYKVWEINLRMRAHPPQMSHYSE